MKSIQDLAREAASHFAPRTRANGERFVALRDESPEWVRDLVREAHGDMLPDDWRHCCIRDALEWIAQADDPAGGAHEFADTIISNRMGDLTMWLGSDVRRARYCDGAAEAGGGAMEVRVMLQDGQAMEAVEVFGLVCEALRAIAD